jgi:hypothetical protein
MAVDWHSWSTTAGSNTTINSIDIDEAWAAADINNSIREMMAQNALARKLQSGSITTGGSANAHTLASGFSLSAYQQDFPIVFEAGYTNTATATLNLDSIGTKVFKAGGQILLPGDIVAGNVYSATYEAGGDVVVLWNPSNQRSIVGVNAQTGTTYTLALADAGKIVTMSNASSNTLTIPPNSSVAFLVGTVVTVRMKGAGQTTVTAGSGVTLNGTSTGSADLSGRFYAATIVQEAANTWSIFGGHAAVS